ncbi:ArnT family glycosyltransferase [Patescibacteria group bacterium]
MTKKKIFWILSIIFGLIYRLWLGSLAQLDLVWDSMFYSSMASEIASGINIANCCNIGPGYPLFVGLVYKLFGIDNIVAVRILQAVVDVISAILVYLVARRFFTKKGAVISFILYITNPITSSYTGVVLTEVFTLFLVITLVYIWTSKKFPVRPVGWIVFGFVLGALVITKIGFYQFALFLLVITVFVRIKKKRLLYMILASSSFLLATFYSIYINYHTFGKLSAIPPYRTLYGSLYFSVEKQRAGELKGEPVEVSDEYAQYIQKYYDLYVYNPSAVVEFDRTYREKLFTRFKTYWVSYIGHFFQNNLWMWDKYHLYVYHDPFYPADIWPVRVLNVCYISFFLIGLGLFIRKTKIWYPNPMIVFSLLLLIYMAGIFPLFNNETRLSLPFYPLIFLWGGYGVSRFISQK